MTQMRLLILLISFLSGVFLLTPLTWAEDSVGFNKNKPLEMTRITPEGFDVPLGRQIVFTFNQPVVPLSNNMEREAADIPITITPALQCQWRWLDTKSLACQLGDEEAFKPATRYEIMVKPGIMTETQKILAKPIQHAFITQRPAIRYTSFISWRAPGMPKIRVKFNQAVTRHSVVKHIYLEKSNQRVPVTVELPPRDEDEAPLSSLVSESWIVSPKILLPLDTKVSLKVEPGIQSKVGSQAGVEKRTVVKFHTFPEFQFLGIECTNLKNKSVFIRKGQWSRDSMRCDPLQSITLQFTSPILSEVIKNNLLITPDLASGRTDYDPWENISSYSHLEESHGKDEIYKVWLPAPLKAYTTYTLKSGTIAFKDEFGRSLPSPIELTFKTDHRAPKHVLVHEISVLEKGVDSDVPLFVTNLDKISLFYQRFSLNGWHSKKYQRLPVPKVRDVAFKMPLGIRDLLQTDSGIVQGYFTTQPDINNKEAKEYNWFFSQITPYYLQAKLGHYNTLVWMTELATGLPVREAECVIYRDTYAPKKSLSDPLAFAITDKDGIARLPGTKILDPKLESAYVYGDYQNEARFFVQCQKEQEMALLPLDSEFRVSLYDLDRDYNFYQDMLPKYGHIRTWGATAQGIYKVGDTVQYKLFVRDQSNKALVPAPQEGYALKVIDPMGKVAHEIKALTLSEFGTYHGEFMIPKTAAVGWYQFQLKAKFKEHTTWRPMRVLVSDFTPSPFRVRTELNGELFEMGDKVTIDTSATLHAGGPYANAQTQIHAILSQQALQPSHPQTKGFWFDVVMDDVEDETVLSAEDKKIDDKGQLQTAFTLPKTSKVLYGKLTVESAVRDDRGKDVAHSTTVNYVGRDRFVGLKETSWLLNAGQKATVNLLVIDKQGKPVKGTDIHVKIEHQVTKASRVKGAGNAYLTQYEHEWVEVKKATCLIKSEKTASNCTFIPPKAGAYKITASIKDSKGRPHSTELHQWAVGKDYVVWETAPGHGLEMVAEQENYKVGETARYLVKNPYPGAQALITVERFGILKTWVKTLKSSIEIIEVPVEPDYVPGFFVSVTVMSPRVDKRIENQVDLGKPAFRMGYVKTEVKEPYKELVVDIQTDKKVYKPREQVTINLQAKPKHSPKRGSSQPPIELAVTVLDESVFDLLAQGRNAFDPYKGFYRLDDLDMANFSLIMRLVGRQKFEKKGANAGGDGGASLSMRSLFKFVSYWNPALKTDKEGKAQIQLTVPDNLTGWRVLAMAVTPTDKMGLGDVNFKVNQPIEIRSLLPNQVTSGDQFQAGFTVMNRTNKVRQLEIQLGAAGPIAIAQQSPNEPDILVQTDTVQAKPYQRVTQWLPIKTTGKGTIHFTAQAFDSVTQEKDSLQKTLEVHPRRPSLSAAHYNTVAKNVTKSISIKIPKSIDPEVGGISVTASPTILGNVNGAFEYMRDYPYACWEQKLSKGTMASHYNQLSAYLTDLSWENSQTLPLKTLELAKEYQAPNGGMAYFVAKNDYVSPFLSAYTALTFNWLRDSGSEIPDTVENKLHDYLTTLLRKNITPDFYSSGMQATVRAMALAALAKTDKITLTDLERYQRHLNRMDLFGKALFLSATLPVSKADELRTKTVNKILAHADYTAGKVSFTEKLDSGYKHILSSPLRTQCAILSSLSAYDKLMGQNSEVQDIPFKLMRHITKKRKSRGHWTNTQENMFCMNALREYARVYESVQPSMIVQTWLGQEKLGETQFDSVQNPPVSFTHDMTKKHIGQKAKVKLKRVGNGLLYYTVRLNYASVSEKSKAVNAGIEVHREYHVERNGEWKLLTSPIEIKTGELVRVDLYMSLPAPRFFVVVDDPVPGGLEPVNRELATTSTVALNQTEGHYAKNSRWFKRDDWEEYGEWGSFYHKELRHHAAIFYSDYLSAGHYHLSYVAQAIAPGKFKVMSTHAEEMYEPDVYGKGLPALMTVVREQN
jgi:alpha-2-macroglobulin